MTGPLCRPNPVSPRGGWAPPPPTRSHVREAAGVAGSGGPAVRRGQGSAVTPPSKFRLLLDASSETPPQVLIQKADKLDQVQAIDRGVEDRHIVL